MSSLEIYTDGACHGSTKVGGLGIVFVKENNIIYQFNKQYTNTTNNRMEIMAVIYALHAISKPIDNISIYSDSQYVLGCITKGKRKKKNTDLWQLFDKVYNKAKKYCSNFKFIWVKGHDTNKFNNIADSLAVEASNYS